MSERGSMLPFMAALIFVALAVVALASDVIAFAATYREAAFAADAGAEAGAGVIDRVAAYGGELRLDPTAAAVVAREAALGARPRTGRTATVDATPVRVCVTVSEPFAPRFGPAAMVNVTGCAEPRRG